MFTSLSLLGLIWGNLCRTICIILGKYFNYIFMKNTGITFVMCAYVWKVKVKSLSHVWLFSTPWTYQAALSMGFSRQEYWSGLPFPSPGDLPDPGIEPSLPHCRQTLYCLSYQGSPMCVFIVGINIKLELSELLRICHISFMIVSSWKRKKTA